MIMCTVQFAGVHFLSVIKFGQIYTDHLKRNKHKTVKQVATFSSNNNYVLHP